MTKDIIFKAQELRNKGFDLAYNKVGDGEKVIFTFAGVGMDERYFTKYFNDNESEFTFYHFFIKVHSFEHKEEIPYLWRGFIKQLLAEHDLRCFTIVSYSIGSRLSFPLLDLPQLEEVLMVCPDGVYEHPVYRLATQTLVGAVLFSPIFTTIRFVIPGLGRFVKLSSKELFCLWKLYSSFKFPSSLPTKTTVFLAEKDMICPSQSVLKVLLGFGIVGFVEPNTNHFSILSPVKSKLIYNLK